jgi:glycosyltransferase involved in cell wall biosynthesis
LLALQRELPRYDVVHVHLGRDLITLPAAWLAQKANIPYVTQTHGMISADQRLRARGLDSLLTRRLLVGAERNFVLTGIEQQGLSSVVEGLRLQILPNGVPLPGLADEPNRGDVLFCSRLHPRKRPMAFVEMASELISRGVDARFAMVGPDEGELEAVQGAIRRGRLEGRLTYEGARPYEQVGERLARCKVFVLPSVDEPYPMVLLEALARGRPVVCTSGCGIAPELAATGAALVVEPSAAALADAVHQLLSSESDRAALSRAARAAAGTTFSIDSVAATLERTYADICAASRLARS